MVLILSIALPIILLYSFFIFFLSARIHRFRSEQRNSSSDPEPVTLIIPFRDEEKHLSDLVSDLVRQAYPQDHFEVIFVNDHSQDGSKILLDGLIENMTRFRCLELPEGHFGKKEALSLGVQHAQYEWIIQTDADCRLGPRFIASHISFKEMHPSDLVAGLVTTGPGSGSFLESFERLDLLSLVGSGAGSFFWGRPLMCNGANLAFSRELYQQTRPFDPSGEVASGDDMFMMIGARKLGKTLSFITNRESMVITGPAGSLADLVAQRIRWGSKTANYGIADIQLFALLVVVTHLLILLIPVLLWISPGSWPWLLTGFVIKTMADFTLLFRISGITGQREVLRAFLPASLLYYLYLPLIFAGALLKRPSWKGRHSDQVNLLL